LVYSSSQSRRRPRLGGDGHRLDDRGAFRALDDHQLRLAHCDVRHRRSRMARDYSCGLARS
jgi:hypothetical protein